MAEFLLRPPTEADLPEITDCWQRSFGDPPELICGLLDTGELLRCAMAAEQDGHLRSVMFAFDGLCFDSVPAAYLYALCTHPEARGQGMGQAVLRALTGLCFDRGAELVFLCPADARLEAWYCSMGMRSLSRTTAAEFTAAPGDPDAVFPIPSEEYAALRTGSAVFPPRLLRAQELLSRRSGGGFYRVGPDGASAVLCAEPAPGNALRIPELCCRDADRAAVLGSAAAAFQADVLQPVGAAPLVYLTKDASAPPPAALAGFPFILD